VLGILVETTAEEPDLPFDATLEESGIVGPSAGLMLALTAADLLREEDLAAGRRIAGTGTIDLDGRVGPVGGVPQKARAAVAADVDLLLVPLGQLDQAAAAAEAGIEVVGVATFQDALDALRGTGVAAP
jgi:PDZ domain-containing protein